MGDLQGIPWFKALTTACLWLFARQTNHLEPRELLPGRNKDTHCASTDSKLLEIDDLHPSAALCQFSGWKIRRNSQWLELKSIEASEFGPVEASFFERCLYSGQRFSHFGRLVAERIGHQFKASSKGVAPVHPVPLTVRPSESKRNKEVDRTQWYLIPLGGPRSIFSSLFWLGSLFWGLLFGANVVFSRSHIPQISGHNPS